MDSSPPPPSDLENFGRGELETPAAAEPPSTSGEAAAASPGLAPMEFSQSGSGFASEGASAAGTAAAGGGGQNDDVVAMFVSITGTDAATAAAMLEAMGGDVDAAVSMYLETYNPTAANAHRDFSGMTAHGFGGGNSFSAAMGSGISSGGSLSSSGAAASPPLGRMPLPLPENPFVGPSFGRNLDSAAAPPPFFAAGAAGAAAGGASGGGGSNFGQDVNQGEGDAEVRAPMPTISDRLIGLGASSMQQHEVEKDETEWIFHAPTGLSLPLPLADMRAMCKEQKKWLLVNIQDPSSFHSHQLNRVWANDTIRDLLSGGFLFWQRNCTSSQGREFIQRYRVPLDRLPHTAILDPRTGLALMKVEGLVEADDMGVALVEFLESNAVDQTTAPSVRTVSMGHLSRNQQGKASPSAVPIHYDVNGRKEQLAGEEVEHKVAAAAALSVAGAASGGGGGGGGSSEGAASEQAQAHLGEEGAQKQQQKQQQQQQQQQQQENGEHHHEEEDAMDEEGGGDNGSEYEYEHGDLSDDEGNPVPDSLNLPLPPQPPAAAAAAAAVQSGAVARAPPVPAEPPENAAGATRMSISLPDGRTVARRFLLDDTVAALFAAAKSLLSEGEDQERPFDLSTKFPRRSLRGLPGLTLRQADLANSSMVLTWL